MTTSGDREEASRPPALRDPITFILAAHRNHRRMCRALEILADSAAFDGALIAAVADFVRFDLTLHVIDEEEDLFPMLRKRCAPDEQIDEVLTRLSFEHDQDNALSVRVRDVLNACLILRKPPCALDGAAEALRAFAQHEAEHLALENAVVLPLARRRFDAADLQELSKRLLARRRRTPPPSA